MGSKLTNFYVQSFPKMLVIGKSVPVKMDVGVDDPTITDLLESMKKDGSLDFLLALPGRLTEAADTVGWMGDVQPDGGTYIYLAGVLFQPGTAVPEGYESREIAAAEMAVGWIHGTEGEEGGDMFANASGHLSQAREAHGYEYDGSNGGFEMEYYSYERFRGPFERGEQPVLDFYSPCKKKQVSVAAS